MSTDRIRDMVRERDRDTDRDRDMESNTGRDTNRDTDMVNEEMTNPGNVTQKNLQITFVAEVGISLQDFSQRLIYRRKCLT
jgi:hypothetical protein